MDMGDTLMTELSDAKAKASSRNDSKYPLPWDRQAATTASATARPTAMPTESTEKASTSASTTNEENSVPVAWARHMAVLQQKVSHLWQPPQLVPLLQKIATQLHAALRSAFPVMSWRASASSSVRAKPPLEDFHNPFASDTIPQMDTKVANVRHKTHTNPTLILYGAEGTGKRTTVLCAINNLDVPFHVVRLQRIHVPTTQELVRQLAGALGCTPKTRQQHQHWELQDLLTTLVPYYRKQRLLILVVEDAPAWFPSIPSTTQSQAQSQAQQNKRSHSQSPLYELSEWMYTNRFPMALVLLSNNVNLVERIPSSFRSRLQPRSLTFPLGISKNCIKEILWERLALLPDGSSDAMPPLSLMFPVFTTARTNGSIHDQETTTNFFATTKSVSTKLQGGTTSWPGEATSLPGGGVTSLPGGATHSLHRSTFVEQHNASLYTLLHSQEASEFFQFAQQYGLSLQRLLKLVGMIVNAWRLAPFQPLSWEQHWEPMLKQHFAPVGMRSDICVVDDVSQYLWPAWVLAGIHGSISLKMNKKTINGTTNILMVLGHLKTFARSDMALLVSSASASASASSTIADTKEISEVPPPELLTVYNIRWWIEQFVKYEWISFVAKPTVSTRIQNKKKKLESDAKSIIAEDMNRMLPVAGNVMGRMLVAGLPDLMEVAAKPLAPSSSLKNPPPTNPGAKHPQHAAHLEYMGDLSLAAATAGAKLPQPTYSEKTQQQQQPALNCNTWQSLQDEMLYICKFTTTPLFPSIEHLLLQNPFLARYLQHFSNPNNAVRPPLNPFVLLS